MTNAMIIMQEKIRLADEGILKVVGTTEFETSEGEIIEVPDIQTIHTYQTWKKLGYQVKKGEKAVAKFAVWKYLTKKKKEEDVPEDADEEKKVVGRCYMKMSAFFTDEQVEKIQKGK